LAVPAIDPDKLESLLQEPWSENIKRDFDPSMVLTHWQGDAHQDHRLLAELTVFGESQRPRVVVIVEPAIAVKAAIDPDNLESVLQEPRPENSADIPINTGYQYPHSRHIPFRENCSSYITKVSLWTPD
jgi:LmbE family N-acetylglucosaminyl deacetylase